MGKRMEFVLGTAAFAAFFAYDIDSVRPVQPWFHRLFAAGCVLLAAANGLLVWNHRALLTLNAVSLLLGGGALAFAALMVYTLFFALPFGETYLEENAPRAAYTGGMYALCRHPGVLWFAGAYLCLAGLLGTPKAAAFSLLVIGLNLAYILLQDAWTFPKSFVNYEEYRRTTPFLVPTPASAARCARTWKGGEGR